MVGDEQLFLGDNLLPWLLFAVGSALAVANIALLIRPPRVDPRDPNSPRRESPPMTKVAPMIVLGLILAIWAAASLWR